MGQLSDTKSYLEARLLDRFSATSMEFITTWAELAPIAASWQTIAWIHSQECRNITHVMLAVTRRSFGPHGKELAQTLSVHVPTMTAISANACLLFLSSGSGKVSPLLWNSTAIQKCSEDQYGNYQNKLVCCSGCVSECMDTNSYKEKVTRASYDSQLPVHISCIV